MGCLIPRSQGFVSGGWQQEVRKGVNFSKCAFGGERYYLRAVEDDQSRASARRRPHAAARGVVVECMDRACWATLSIFTQTLPVGRLIRFDTY